MTPAALLHDLESRGLRVRVLGDQIRISPAASLPRTALEPLRRMKPDLLVMLRVRDALRAAGRPVQLQGELEVMTGLPRDAIRKALAGLYEVGKLGTSAKDPSRHGVYAWAPSRCRKHRKAAAEGRDESCTDCETPELGPGDLQEVGP